MIAMEDNPFISDEERLEEDDADVLLPLTDEELQTVRSALGDWENRMCFTEDDTEDTRLEQRIANRLYRRCKHIY